MDSYDTKAAFAHWAGQIGQQSEALSTAQAKIFKCMQEGQVGQQAGLQDELDTNAATELLAMLRPIQAAIGRAKEIENGALTPIKGGKV